MESYNFYEKKKLDTSCVLGASEQSPDMTRGEGYQPSEALIQAVNVALMLQKPLLLTGLPGTGKSELAYHLANHFGWGEVLYFATRTNSSATDLLYRYDSLAHFNMVNIQKNGGHEITASEIEEKFIHYVALGKAIIDSQTQQRRMVLIDEIDKAPRDLPNDILSTLETMEFDVAELRAAPQTSEKLSHKVGNPCCKPVVILTSNSEKSLPDAFLRRCVFFHIDMPSDEQLQAILLAKGRILPDITPQEALEFIALFRALSKLIRGKQPATHELILWVWWMQKHGFTCNDLLAFDSSSSNKEMLLSGISILAKESEDWKALIQAIRKGSIKPE